MYMTEEKILKKLNNIKDELVSAVIEIHDNPELGNEEFNTCKIHTDLLKKYGFIVTEKFCNTKTGYKAEFYAKKKKPVIAFLSEYDALPGIGHGCGHNISGITAISAGIALKEIIEEIGEGTVVIFGTPAEETCGAKVIYAENHEFDNVDIAILAHPGNKYAKSGKTLALEPIQFEFYGKSSHAASAPEHGINALDAAINTFNNINALREHIRSDSRIHGIIVDGGKAANIVPDYTKVQFYIRSTTKSYLAELVEKVKNCALGASLASGTELKISKFEFSYDNIVTNENLSALFTKQLKKITDVEIHEPQKSFGSADTGNVSLICPTIHPYFDITGNTQIAAHTIEMADCTTKPYAHDNMIITAAAIAMTGVEIINHPELLKEMWNEFYNSER